MGLGKLGTDFQVSPSPLPAPSASSQSTLMSSAAAGGISHNTIHRGRHVIDPPSSVYATNILSSAPPLPRSFFASHLNYALKSNHSRTPLPSRRPLDRLRSSDFNPKVNDGLFGDSRDWSRSIGRSDLLYDDDDEYEDDEDEEEEDRSLDLFVKFVQNVYRKMSKRARKAVRSVLPTIIPSKLVGFSVDGVMVLAFLWVLKAFLEVVCTLGSMVFVSILLTRVVWTGVTYLQESRILRMNGDDDDDDDRRAWTGSRPAT